jgi:hypothetical protein
VPQNIIRDAIIQAQLEMHFLTWHKQDKGDRPVLEEWIFSETKRKTSSKYHLANLLLDNLLSLQVTNVGVSHVLLDGTPRSQRAPRGGLRKRVRSRRIFAATNFFFISLTTTITITSILYKYKCFNTSSQQDVDVDTTTMINAKPNRSKNLASVVNQR